MAIKKLNPEDLTAPSVGGVVERPAVTNSSTEDLTMEGEEETDDEELADGEEAGTDNLEIDSIDEEDVPGEDDESDDSDEITVDDGE